MSEEREMSDEKRGDAMVYDRGMIGGGEFSGASPSTLAKRGEAPTMAVDIDAWRKLAREAKGRADGAQPAPWKADGSYVVRLKTTDWCVAACSSLDRSQNVTTAEFIAAARSDVPALADALEAACKVIERLTRERAEMGLVSKLIEENAKDRAEIARMRPVVEAAKGVRAKLYAGRQSVPFAELNALADAVDNAGASS